MCYRTRLRGVKTPNPAVTSRCAAATQAGTVPWCPAGTSRTPRCGALRGGGSAARTSPLLDEGARILSRRQLACNRRRCQYRHSRDVRMPSSRSSWRTGSRRDRRRRPGPRFRLGTFARPLSRPWPVYRPPTLGGTQARRGSRSRAAVGRPGGTGAQRRPFTGRKGLLGGRAF